MKRYILAISLILMVMITAACGDGNGNASNAENSSGEEKVLRVAHTQAQTHPVHISLEKFGELVEEKTNGSVTIEIFPSGTLGDERQYMENLQTGTLDMAKLSVNTLENYEDLWSIFSIPYVFQDMAHGAEYMNSEVVENLYNLTTDSMDILGLTWYEAGARNYYTRDTPIEAPEDLNGLLMRVQNSEILIKTIEALGGSATPIDFSELYTAIQQGVVEGADNGIVAFSENNLGEVAKHFSFTEHVFSPDILVIKSSVFEGLTAEEQEAVKEAAVESTDFHNDNWEEETEQAIQKAEDAGATIYYPELEPFREALQPLKESYADENEEIAELMEEIDAMR